MNKKDLSERDICTKFITPAIEQAGWDINTQVREEVPFTVGRIIIRCKTIKRVPKNIKGIMYVFKKKVLVPVITLKVNIKKSKKYPYYMH